MLCCSVVNSNELNVYGKKIVNYVTLIILRYPIEEYLFLQQCSMKFKMVST